MTDYHVPVDRWVYFVATYDGCYLSVFCDGELVASKCRGPDTTGMPSKHDCVFSDAGPVTIGGCAGGANNFVGSTCVCC